MIIQGYAWGNQWSLKHKTPLPVNLMKEGTRCYFFSRHSCFHRDIDNCRCQCLVIISAYHASLWRTMNFHYQCILWRQVSTIFQPGGNLTGVAILDSRSSVTNPGLEVKSRVNAMLLYPPNCIAVLRYFNNIKFTRIPSLDCLPKASSKH